MARFKNCDPVDRNRVKATNKKGQWDSLWFSTPIELDPVDRMMDCGQAEWTKQNGRTEATAAAAMWTVPF